MAVRGPGTTLTEVFGVGLVIAAIVIGCVRAVPVSPLVVPVSPCSRQQACFSLVSHDRSGGEGSPAWTSAVACGPISGGCPRRLAGPAGSDGGDRVAAADGAAADHRSVHADVHRIVLGGRLEDSRVFGQITLGSVIITQRGQGSVI